MLKKILRLAFKGIAILLCAIIVLSLAYCSVFAIWNKIDFERSKKEALMRLPEIKDELSACVDRLVPYLKDYGEKVALRDYEDKDRYYRVEDTEKWRLRYGDEVAEDIQKLLSFDFESISFNPHMCEMGFSISHGYSRGYYYYNPYSTKIEAYIDEEEGRYYDQYFGDGWGYEIREGYP